MPHLDFGGTGGELTGSGLDFNRPDTSTRVPVTPPVNINADPISGFSGVDKLKFLVASGLGGMGGGQNTFLAGRQSNIKAIQASEQAKKARDIKILEVMIKGANAINGTKGFTQKLALRKSISKQLEDIDPEAATSFREISDSPSITEIVSDPKKAELFGGLQTVLTQFEGTPAERSTLKQTIIEQNRAAIHDKLFKLRDRFPEETNMDVNEDGVATATEARVWVKRHHESKKIPDNMKLTPAEMEVFQFDEFEEDLAATFGVRTRKAVAGAQEKNMVRAINKQGETVFATEEQLRTDPTLKPEPRAPLVSFGGEKKSEALFESLVKRRDTLLDQASNARTQKNLALQMRETAERVATGVGTETVVNLKSFGGTIARLLGSDVLANKIQTEGDAEVLRSLNTRGVSTLIKDEKQGQVAVAERTNWSRSLPGLANSKSGNIAISHMMSAQATSKIEEAAFIESITDSVANRSKRSDLGSSQAFTDYITDLPWTKGVGEDIRHVDDGQKLWRYYLDGRPSKWMFPGKDFTMAEIKVEADKHGLTTREFLAIADRKGVIRGVIQ